MTPMNLTHRHIATTLDWSVTALTVADVGSWPLRTGTAADERSAWLAVVAAAEELLTEHGLPDVRLVIAGDLVGTYAPGRDGAGRPDPDAVRAGLADMRAAADPAGDPLGWVS